ncbi:MAG: c-type cytochrome [Verrucomicrobiae bacterium]|nr:c-type cytochrome [Verrucomicrobiae bacterium]MCP5540587.1 c-type cytochrome [Akkermansiaceae bacterium]
MKPFALTFITFVSALHAAEPFATPLSPGDEAKTFVLPEGYIAECIASEPMVEEPVLAVWDGNGALYVAEMRSYMQDENGTGTKTLKNGRIKRLTSSRGEGIMDEATVFVDGLNLPRMILPLDDRIAVVETDSTTVWSYRDTNGDGVADEKVELFKGKAGDPDKSVEHQDSGLIWNIDNRIYLSYAKERYRFTDGTWRAEPLHPVWSQWGIAHDDEGRIFYSDNSKPALGFDLPRRYWLHISQRNGDKIPNGEIIDLGMSWEPSFLNAKNLCAVDDRGGPAGTTKTFTSLCGQSIYRDDAVPEWNGDYFICDPTIHVVRRAKLTRENGRVRFANAHGGDEFMLSPHILFRPVNTAPAPDGSLIVVDMYRGIIQDAPWLSPAPRKFIKESGLADVHQHGRIWRIRKTDSPKREAPRLLEETTSELVAHLAHPSGWWRDTAQRLIILRQDRDRVMPSLKEMASTHVNPLARLHALWTLEGCAAIDETTLSRALNDEEPRVRRAAVEISEVKLNLMLPKLAELATRETSGDVAKQFILTLGFSKNDEIVLPAVDALLEKHLTHEGVFQAACVTFWKHPTPFMETLQDGTSLAGRDDAALLATRWKQGFAQWERDLTFAKDFPKDQKKSIESGEVLFFQTCVACHGPDGKGTNVPGTDLAIAPPLAGSARVKGDAKNLLPVFMNGLVGPIDGKTYQGAMMVPAAALGIVRDDRLADVVNFIRYAWDNNAAPVTTEQVKQARQAATSRSAPWTDDELKTGTTH